MPPVYFTLYYNIIVVSVILWLLPPIRNYKTNFFIYFLVYAISDPIAIILSKFHLWGSITTFSILSYFILLSLKKFTSNSKLYDVILVFTFCLTLFIVFFEKGYSYAVFILMHFFIFFTILRKTILNIAQTFTINIFYFVILFYEATTIIKFLISLLDTQHGKIQLLVVGTFQILFAVFFTIFNENSRKMKVKLKVEAKS
ncbi:hypothetical protein ABRY23_09805 [Melioribacteraceae bacterium 4301-Me]|uniref:hypothetical protein n=1 Tax=Pyranulibacter aquaticus TaxID=3163344 RepID=UPI003599A573